MIKTLFYLEDDMALAKATERAFIKRDYEVCLYTSLAEANDNIVNNLSTHALLDLKLDDGHSLTLISSLLKANPNIRIVVLTGYASVATAVQAIKLGAVNYLSKPATIEQIISAFDDCNSSYQCVDIDDMSLKRLEWERIQQVLVENNGNISATARQLKMHRRTLQRKLHKKPVSE